MRSFSICLLVAVSACRCSAAEDEAEKLFRAMEKSVRAAKTLRLKCEVEVIDAADRKLPVKGELLLGKGDKLRRRIEGRVLGEKIDATLVSDGIRQKETMGPANTDAPEHGQKPDGLGAYYRESLPTVGFFLASLNGDEREKRVAEKLSGFKLAGEEKLGDRDAIMLEFTIGADDKAPLAVKLWLDAKTNLPIKRTIAGGKSDIKAVTETYSELALDGKVDGNVFEIPK